MSKLVFQNYHRHSERTNPMISDSTVKNEDYAKAAVERGHQILASTEHGYQGRYIECYDLAKEYNLKFLFATEAYWVKDRTQPDNNNCHIWIGAKNENGRQCINDILSEANLTGFYYRPRLDVPLILSLPKDDVWVTSACIAGWKYDDADEIFRTMFDHFGKNFFLEVQYHNTQKQKELNKHILTLHDQWKCPIIMGCDSHYITEDQATARDDFLVSKGLNYEDEAGWYLDYPTGETAYERFATQNILSHSQIIDAIANTNTFLDVQEYESEIFNEEIKMPSLHPEWTQEQKDTEYERLVWQGYDEYKSKIDPSLYPLYEKEIKSEIAIVKETKMADYFIDNYYIIKKGKENGGWLTKSGRGCFAKDSLVKTPGGNVLIQDIKYGDVVYDLDRSERRVTSLFHYTEESPMTNLHYTENGIQQTIQCTPDHKILCYVNGERVWRAAKSLIIGDELCTHSGTKAFVTQSILYPTKVRDWYDIEVEGTHSYVVNDVVVHNSAVSFITNKLLGFTEVDRIAAKVKMYPERFMSTTRIIEAKTLPDIDFNVAPVEPFARAQKEVLGEEHAYPMISYGTFQKSAAWKLYAKAKGIPFEVANAVSDQLKKYEMAVKHADDDEKDSIDVQDFIEPQYVDIFNDSKEYMGLITSWSIAPCSYLLYAGNIRREIGLVKIKDHVCCLMDGAWAEKKHFLKNDMLKVSVVELIYKSYHAAGMEPPDVNDLLKMAPPEDDCWQMYAKSCVKGLNQVEKPGTSSRVAKYAPKNISEMCAFVAAIRPGFRSMFSTFESRKPFDYGVKQFDDLIQTEEMPNSFLLYQEHIMTALNYAGIPMSECYTAIKNIAKKRAEKVLAYKDKFITGLTAAIVKDGKTEVAAKVVAEKLWQIIEDSAQYSFNACLTGDTKIACSDGNYSIKELYDRYNNGTYKHRDLRGKKEKDKRIYGKALSLADKDIVCPNVIVDIRPAGERPIYVITTKNGQTVSCTGNHKFPTPIGELPCSLLFDDDALYDVDLSKKKPYYKPHMSWITSIEKTDRVEQTYDVEMAAPNHNFVLDNGLIVSNSHSYCVSLDSLYSAWIKAHYPLAFYETLLQITESKGDKDKLVEIKHEAEDYFNITFPSFKFGQDNRAIRANLENNSISNSLTSIKNMPKATPELLWQVAQTKPTTMIDVLIRCNNLHVSSAAIEMLAKIGYFDAFGNIPEIMRILNLYDFFNKGTAKTVSKKKELAPELFDIVKKYATDRNAKGEELSSYTITSPEINKLKAELAEFKKIYKKTPSELLEKEIAAKSEEVDFAICNHESGMLREMEAYILSKGIEDLDYANKIQNQIDILGYVDLYSGKEEDRRKLFVEDIRPIKDKKKGDIWCYRIDTRSIGSGKTSSLTVPVESYKEYPIKKNDIISVPQGALKKNRKGYWYLYFYDKVYA